jgi:hypothetical protein
MLIVQLVLCTETLIQQLVHEAVASDAPSPSIFGILQQLEIQLSLFLPDPARLATPGGDEIRKPFEERKDIYGWGCACLEDSGELVLNVVEARNVGMVKLGPADTKDGRENHPGRVSANMVVVSGRGLSELVDGQGGLCLLDWLQGTDGGDADESLVYLSLIPPCLPVWHQEEVYIILPDELVANVVWRPA